MKVSVLVITYNHDRFIAQALDSILSQQVTFDLEVIVGEDCSTDNTRSIVEDYSRRYPNTVVAILNPHNVGMKDNGFNVMSKATGKYVAFLEGDDYWVSDHKLQQQVDLLESDSRLAGCFTDSLVVDHTNSVIKHTYYEQKPKAITTTQDIVPFGISPANTILVKSEVLEDFPQWFKDSPRHSGIDLLVTLHGGFAFIDEVMGAYRVHDGGVWSSASVYDRLLSDLTHLKAQYNDLDLRKQYRHQILTAIREQAFSLTSESVQRRSPWRLLGDMLRLTFRGRLTVGVPFTIAAAGCRCLVGQLLGALGAGKVIHDQEAGR